MTHWQFSNFLFFFPTAKKNSPSTSVENLADRLEAQRLEVTHVGILRENEETILQKVQPEKKKLARHSWM